MSKSIAFVFTLAGIALLPHCASPNTASEAHHAGTTPSLVDDEDQDPNDCTGGITEVNQEACDSPSGITEDKHCDASPSAADCGETD